MPRPRRSRSPAPTTPRQRDAAPPQAERHHRRVDVGRRRGRHTTGEVTRPAHGTAAKTVEVTATVNKGSSSATRTFSLVVQPLPEKAGARCVLLPFFTGESTTTDEEISFATSRGNDPKSWLTLNDGAPVLTSDQGEEGIRDPFVIALARRGPLLHAVDRPQHVRPLQRRLRTRAGGRQPQAQRLAIRRPRDLEPAAPDHRVERVRRQHVGTRGHVGPDRGEYVVYWASNLYPSASTDGRRPADSYNRMMMVTTRDFVTFSEPQPWVDVKRGAGKGTIDATVVRDGDTYYRFIKDEASMTVRQERSTDLTATVTGSLPTTTSTPGGSSSRSRSASASPTPGAARSPMARARRCSPTTPRPATGTCSSTSRATTAARAT